MDHTRIKKMCLDRWIEKTIKRKLESPGAALSKLEAPDFGLAIPSKQSWTEYMALFAKHLAHRPTSIGTARTYVASVSAFTDFSGGTLVDSTTLAPSLQDIQMPASSLRKSDMDSYELGCEFEDMGCAKRFRSTELEDWVLHGAAHFVGKSPPTRSMCLFCDVDEFNNWRDRMLHIATHFRDGVRMETSRPDFFVIEHLYKCHLLTPGDFDNFMAYTERTSCDNLVDPGFQTPEMISRSARNEKAVSQQRYDLAREARQIRRRAGIRDKGKSISSYRQNRPDRGIRRRLRDASDELSSDESTFEPVVLVGRSHREPVYSREQVYDNKASWNPSPSYQAADTRMEQRSQFGNQNKSLELAVRKSIHLPRNTSGHKVDVTIPGTIKEVSENSFSKSTPTTSASSEDETDWEEDDCFHELASENTAILPVPALLLELSHIPAGTVPDLTKTHLVEKLLKYAFAVLNQYHCGYTQHGSSSTESGCNLSASANSRTGGRDNKRQRDLNEEDTEDDYDQAFGRKGKEKESTGLLQSEVRFACPYRKNDPRKYCIQNWKQCAITGHTTVARVKAHLYRYHLVYECKRCKSGFKSEEELDMHAEAAAGCQPQKSLAALDGITSKLREQIRSRKRVHPQQTEEFRWKHLYEMIFPGNTAPNPYFELPLDFEEARASREGLDLQGLYQHIRRAVEVEVAQATEDIEPIVEGLRGRIIEIVDRAYSTYQMSGAGQAPDTDAASQSCSITVPYPISGQATNGNNNNNGHSSWQASTLSLRSDTEINIAQSTMAGNIVALDDLVDKTSGPDPAPGGESSTNTGLMLPDRVSAEPEWSDFDYLWYLPHVDHNTATPVIQ